MARLEKGRCKQARLPAHNSRLGLSRQAAICLYMVILTGIRPFPKSSTVQPQDCSIAAYFKWGYLETDTAWLKFRALYKMGFFLILISPPFSVCLFTRQTLIQQEPWKHSSPAFGARSPVRRLEAWHYTPL